MHIIYAYIRIYTHFIFAYNMRSACKTASMAYPACRGVHLQDEPGPVLPPEHCPMHILDTACAVLLLAVVRLQGKPEPPPEPEPEPEPPPEPEPEPEPEPIKVFCLNDGSNFDLMKDLLEVRACVRVARACG